MLQIPMVNPVAAPRRLGNWPRVQGRPQRTERGRDQVLGESISRSLTSDLSR